MPNNAALKIQLVLNNQYLHLRSLFGYNIATAAYPVNVLEKLR